MKRRTILLSALGVSGALLVGWGVAPPRSRLGNADSMLPTEGSVGLNGWIKIAEDGSVSLAMPRSEMGQGVHTALAMLAAEELDIPLDKVRLEQAGPDAMYGNVAAVLAFLPFHPQQTEEGKRSATVKTAQWLTAKVGRELGLIMTGGSSSVADAWEPVRLAAAALLARTPHPTDADIDAAMSNICRCGTYQRVRAAIHRAANSVSSGATKSASNSAAPKASGSAA